MGTTDTQTPSVEEQVNNLLKEHVNDEGKLELPKDIDPLLAAAVRATKMQRDTQASYTKVSQKASKLQEQVAQYKGIVTEIAPLQLTQEQEEELEALKFEDPDKWREKLTQYEADAKAQLQGRLESADIEAQKAAEIRRREEVLNSYNDFLVQNGKKPITDEVIQELVPPRLLKQLENGNIAFDEFLQEVSRYIDTPKTFAKKEEVLDQPNLSDAAGGAYPSKPTAEDVVTNYNSSVF